MKEMGEIPNLDLASPSESLVSRRNFGPQKILVPDNVNAFQFAAEKPDSFVIDMEAFSSGSINKDSNTNSRITLQRSLSRKGSQRGGDKKVNVATALHDWDTVPAAPPCSPSPKGAAPLVGSCTSEKSAVVAVGSTDHCTSPQVHHQITITASNITTTTINEGKCIARRNSFRRSSNSWALDPKRILLLFATLSSMGSILLIYFTLTISKQNAAESGGDWQH